MVSPWNTGLGNSTFSKPRLPTVVPSVVSPTLRPTATPSVNRLLTKGFPNSAVCAALKSTWSGCGFMVRHENQMLSASVTVRPGWCWNTCPTVSSSNSLPAMAISFSSDVSGFLFARRPVGATPGSAGGPTKDRGIDTAGEQATVGHAPQKLAVLGDD